MQAEETLLYKHPSAEKQRLVTDFHMIKAAWIAEGRPASVILIQALFTGLQQGPSEDSAPSAEPSNSEPGSGGLVADAEVQVTPTVPKDPQAVADLQQKYQHVLDLISSAQC